MSRRSPLHCLLQLRFEIPFLSLLLCCVISSGFLVHSAFWTIIQKLGRLHKENSNPGSRHFRGEERCMFVYAGHGENRVADADHRRSSLAADNERQTCDRKYLISSMYSRDYQNRKSESEISRSISKNRLQGDSTLSDPSSIPGCFLIPEEQQYKTIVYVGGGSYKAVHKCEWMGMKVGIATFHNRGEASKMDLEAEAGLLARVQHPNVITLVGYAYDEVEQQGYLVTELMETNLRYLIDKQISKRHTRNYNPFTLLESIDVLLQIVEAMIHVHECGVIHQDLKAKNCLVNRGKLINGNVQGYVVKLIGFGESKPWRSESGSNFNTRHRGSRAWLAPEVQGTEGDEIKECTWSADVYSFGMTCYEILTSEEPFGTMRGRALTEMVCAGHRPSIPDDCPNGLRELMTKCWAHISEDRPTFKNIRQILWNCKLY